MKAYQKAIQRLANHDWVGNADLVKIISIIRGPDKDDREDTKKRTFTAPLRLYLLGTEAYSEAGYFPHYSQVRRELPPYERPYNHFSGHIYAALDVLHKNTLGPAEGWE